MTRAEDNVTADIHVVSDQTFRPFEDTGNGAAETATHRVTGISAAFTAGAAAPVTSAAFGLHRQFT